MRGRQQRILPLAHRRRPGVVGEAGDRDVVAMNRDDAFDDADRRAALFERAALLDVQLEVRVPRARLAHRLFDA